MRVHRVVRAVLIACLALTAATAAAAPDALADAKRRAAAELLKDGKAAEAVTMLQEVVRADPSQYKDHLQLARAYDKLNRAAEAAEAYQAAADALANARTDDRAARAEIDRRLKVLDANGAKVAAAEAEFLKKLDALERDAVAARDMRALQRVFALRGGVWNARGRREGFGVDLPATVEWFDSGAVVEKGVTYRVRAAGYWTLNGSIRCTADGAPDAPPTQYGVYGHLMAAVEGGGRFEHLSTDSTFVAPATGRLKFINNVKNQEERNRSSGNLYVLVQRVSAG
jgi:tetratricopeptide (TPR) repeat protein